MILFRRWYFGRLSLEQELKLRLLKKLKHIMATLKEVTDQLAEANAALVVANGIAAETGNLIAKIGTETDKLKQQIADLPVPGDAPEDLVAGLEAIKATIANTQALVASNKSGAVDVDDKVPDAEPPPAE